MAWNPWVWLRRLRPVAGALVLASEGYPGDPVTGRVIEGVDEAQQVSGVRVLHAATGEGDTTAKELIEQSEALQDVPAVKEGNIVYLPQDFYVAEDIQNYTTVMEDLADAFAGAR